MFGAGGLGSFLPMLGMLGGGFGGGGLFSLGFTLLSGLLQNIGQPKNPGFENFATHPGFQSAHAHPGFGTMGNGPNVSTVGNMNGYFGSQYSNDYSILPHTPAGQYYGNQGYSYGNQALTYSNYPQPPAQQHQFGNSPYRQNMGHLQFGGQVGQYHNAYNSFAPSYPQTAPNYHYGQTFGSYGSAPAPYSQGYQPVVSHYGFGSPQQYNPASTLYGQQNGSVRVNYGQPQSYTTTTYGGPQGENGQVVHHHHHHHIHLHNHTQPTDDADGDQDYGVETGQDYGTQEPGTQEPGAYEPEKPVEPPKDNYEPPVAVEPTVTPKPTTPAVEEDDSLKGVMVATTGVAAANAPSTPAQTRWGRVPHINSQADYPRASRMVAERVTGGELSAYDFGGRNPDTNVDGMRPERMAAWFVFQQNNDLRLDAKSGYFYQTDSDGKTSNKFHVSKVAGIVGQSGTNSRLGYEMVGDYLEQRGMYANDMARDRQLNTKPVTVNIPQAATTLPPNPFDLANRAPGFG